MLISLDNALAGAGVVQEHSQILVVGLNLAVAMMGAAAFIIAKVLDRFRWIAYVGLFVILIVARRMIRGGGWDVLAALNGD